MGKRVRSAKGELVDFDFIKIKEQLASSPPSVEVKKRQNFIENRLKRRLKKKETIIEKVAVDVEPDLPEPPPELEQPLIVEPALDTNTETKAEDVVTTPPTTKQKAKKKN